MSGNPPCIDVQLCDAAIVAVEECDEVLGQIVLIARIQATHNAEVHGRIARMLRVIEQYKNIAGMHVCMKEVVPKGLREKDFNTILGEPLNVRAASLQFGDIVHEHAAHTLH